MQQVVVLTNSDVDTHLNTGTASTNDVLGWNGSDYFWTAQTGGGASLTVQDLSLIHISEPTRPY